MLYLVVTISLDAFKQSPHLINIVYHTFACFADGGRTTTATTGLVELRLEYLGKVNSGKLSPCCRERFWKKSSSGWLELVSHFGSENQEEQ